MAQVTLSYHQFTSSGGSSVSSLSDSAVTIGADDKEVVVWVVTGSSNGGYQCVLDPGGGDLALTEETAQVNISSGGYHRVYRRDISGDGLSGTYTVTASNLSSQRIVMDVCVVDGAYEDFDQEYNQTNGWVSGLTLTSGGTERLLLSRLATRENRTESLSGDLDTNVLDTSVPTDCAVFRIDTGDVGSGLISSTYTKTGGDTGVIHDAFLFAPAAAGGVTVTPGTATLTWTGYAPTASATGDVTVTPGVAALTWTGHAPTITGATVTATPGLAELLWTGYSPTVRTLKPVLNTYVGPQ